MAEEQKPVFERLPTNVVPNHYILHLNPNLKEFKFVGRCAINIEVSLMNRELNLYKNSCKYRES